LLNFPFAKRAQGVLSREMIFILFVARGDCTRILRILQLRKLRFVFFGILQRGSSDEAAGLHGGLPHEFLLLLGLLPDLNLLDDLIGKRKKSPHTSTAHDLY
jgi:hypothetical protein